MNSVKEEINITVAPPPAEPVNKKRETNLDLLRILACYLVIVQHTAAQGWYNEGLSTYQSVAMNVFISSSVFAVPIFFMISGKLFLSSNHEPSVKKLLLGNVLRLAVIYFIWSAIYAAFEMISKSMPMDPYYFFGALLNSKYHLWFLPSIISVYLVYPLLWCAAKYKNGKFIPYACIMFFVFGTLRPSLLLIPFSNNNVAVLIGVIGYALSDYSGIFMLGYYISTIRTRLPRIRWLVLMFIGSVSITAFVEYIIDRQNNCVTDAAYNKFFLPTIFAGALVYTAFLKMPNLGQRFSKQIAYLSKCTLGVYLVHPILLENTKLWFGFDVFSFDPIVGIIIISLGVFAVCMAVMLLINKIPVINKWLV